METKVSDLAEYLNGILKERNLSVRAFATYAKLAHQYGITGVSLERLQKSLNIDIDEYTALDPGLRRLQILLGGEEEGFREGFYEAAVALYYLVKGVTRPKM